MSRRTAAFLAKSAAAFMLAIASISASGEEQTVERIAFGSCLHQAAPQPIWKSIFATQPQLFVFLGDNIYAATEDINLLHAAYELQSRNPGVIELWKRARVLAIWDDNDYGAVDGGAEYPKKAESQRLFLKHFRVPRNDARWRRPGIYTAYSFSSAAGRIQAILLDTRTFRSPLVKSARPPRKYEPTTDEKSTILGDEQWGWLERQIAEDARLRIIVSSIQVVSDRHGEEGWGNFPHERRRLLDLLSRRAPSVILSGDRHQGELSMIDIGYPLYDLTSSALNLIREEPDSENPYRIGERYPRPNFGLVTVGREEIVLEVRDESGQPRVRAVVNGSRAAKADRPTAAESR